MKRKKTVNGFSKQSKERKLEWIAENCFDDSENAIKEFQSYWLSDTELQNTYDRISENTISNFILPYGVAPNFIINDQPYVIPMVIEERSEERRVGKQCRNRRRRCEWEEVDQ